MTGHDWVIIAGRNPTALAEFEALFAHRPDWQQKRLTGPATIFTRLCCPYAAPPDVTDAAILGTAFPHGGPDARSGNLPNLAWQELRQGSIEIFLRLCWGGFVALSARSEYTEIIRDPSAAMPCYYAQVPGALLIGSSVRVLIEAGLKKPAIGMNLLARSLFRAELPSQETALVGVQELLPGDCLRIDNGSLSVRQVWSPWDHTAIDETIDFNHHAERLQRTVDHCVAAWSSTTHQSLVGVSGGLDSSIVAACLAPAAPSPICLTVSTDDADGDERRQAHKICDHLKLSLIEARYDLADIQIDRPARPDLPRPTGRLIAQGYNAAVSRVADRLGADAFFTGNGGDNVFAFSQSAGAIADRLLHSGPGRDTWRTARDTCRLTGCSLSQAWHSALRIATSPRRYRWKPDRGFLHPDILQTLEREPLGHSWLDAPKGSLPGKAAHIAALLRIQRHLDGTGQMGQIRVINPLMSQPIIEACLSIPGWMWCQGGKNRSVAREAFRSKMPPAITDRISKGGPSGFGAQIVGSFHNRIVERLLDGHLAEGGIIDRVALERRLTDESPNWALDQVRVLELLEAEAWIDHWR